MAWPFGKHHKERQSRDGGASLLETALVLPLLLLMLLGVADLGRTFHTYITVLNAAREGARYGMDRPYDTAGIQRVVREEADGSSVDLADAEITVEQGGSGQPVNVTVRVPFELVLGNLIGLPDIPIQAHSAFRAR